MRKASVIVALILFAALGAAYYYLAPGGTPAGQPPLAWLEAGTFDKLRGPFNAAAGSVRVVALLSPT